MLRIAILVSVLSLLSACATPNVKPFADQTANLATAVVVEKNEFASHLDTILALIVVAKEMEPKEREAHYQKQEIQWESFRDNYTRSMAVVSLLMSEAVSYSSAVVELAEAGETGGTAAESLYGTVKQFTSVAKFAGPQASLPIDLAGSVAGRILTEVATLWTRVEAQKSLKDATIQAQPAVQAIAAGIKEIFSDVNKKILFAIRNNERNFRLVASGRNRMSFYEKFTSPRRLELYYGAIQQNLPMDLAEKGFCIDTEGGVRDPYCISGQELRSLAALQQILPQLRPDYEVYTAGVSAIADWNDEREAKAKAIIAAADIWAKTHIELSEVLDACAGFSGLKRSCGVLTAANLKVAIEKVKYVTAYDYDLDSSSSVSK